MERLRIFQRAFYAEKIHIWSTQAKYKSATHRVALFCIDFDVNNV